MALSPNLVTASAALDVVDVGGVDLGDFQHLFEQFDLLAIGRENRTFQPETLAVGAGVYSGGVHTLGSFGELHVHYDHGVAAGESQT